MDIFIDNIDKSYNGKYVLDHVTLKIHHGECVGVMGKSGSGKSTLARMVIGLEHPDSGKIYYDGKTVNSLNRKERQELRKKSSDRFPECLWGSESLFHRERSSFGTT